LQPTVGSEDRRVLDYNGFPHVKRQYRLLPSSERSELIMRRTISLITVIALSAAMLLLSAVTAFADANVKC
jgi:hypothetical protein